MLLIAKGIQKIHVARRIHQRLMLMLAMYVHQQRRERLERGERQRRARDPADVATAAAEFTGNTNKPAIRIHTERFRHTQCLRII